MSRRIVFKESFFTDRFRKVQILGSNPVAALFPKVRHIESGQTWTGSAAFRSFVGIRSGVPWLVQTWLFQL